MCDFEILNVVKMATINPELTKAQPQKLSFDLSRPERKAHFIVDMAQGLKMCWIFSL